MTQDCQGTHRFHVADVAVVEAEGKVVVIAFCISCGEVKAGDVKVTDSNSPFSLEKTKIEKE